MLCEVSVMFGVMCVCDVCGVYVCDKVCVICDCVV